jgi:adenine-specific DNA methylase
LFSARQVVTLVTLSRQVRVAHNAMLAAGMEPERAKAVTTYLALALDRLADYSSTLCVWTNSGEFIAHTFGRQALPMVWDYVEMIPAVTGRVLWSGLRVLLSMSPKCLSKQLSSTKVLLLANSILMVTSMLSLLIPRTMTMSLTLTWQTFSMYG